MIAPLASACPASRAVYPETSGGWVDATSLRNELRVARQEGEVVFVFFTRVTDCGLLALGVLVEESRLARRQGGRVAVIGMNEALRAQCTVLGAESGLELFSTEREAEDALKSE